MGFPVMDGMNFPVSPVLSSVCLACSIVCTAYASNLGMTD